jgi:hypothetical protein
MIYVPKYTTIEVELPQARARYEGWYVLETFQGVEFPKGSGRVFEFAGTRRRRAEFKNIILNQGFNYVSTNTDFAMECAVGTGNTPETVNDTTLQNFVAGTANDIADSFTAQGAPPYFGSQTWTWRFAEGEAEGILAEAGIGSDNTSVNGSDLWSRALIKDGGGTPTTVEVTANEWLDVSYQLRLYPGMLIDDTGSVSITGSGSHDYVTRNAFVTSGNGWGAYLQTAFPVNDGLGIVGAVFEAGSTLGAVTSGPSGNFDAFADRVAGSYSVDTYAQDCTWSLGLSDGNWAGGFDAMTFYTNVGLIQMSLDPAVDKDALKVFDFTVNWDWGTRTVIP